MVGECGTQIDAIEPQPQFVGPPKGLQPPAGRQQVSQHEAPIGCRQTVAKANKEATLSGGFSCFRSRVLS
ncbi:MAG: hypothetical protein ACK56F_01215, partial [bacterium]